MSRRNDIPFGRGETYYSGRTIDTADLEGVSLEGIEKEFEDVDHSTSPPSPRSSRKVVCRIMRNMSTVALLGKTLGIVDPTNPNRIIGNVKTGAAPHCVAIDEFLPAAGVPYGDLCWVVVSGPTTLKTPPGGSFAANIAAGDWLVSSTGASGTTAAAATTNDNGRVAAMSAGATNNVNLTDIVNRFGKALSAKTTGNTNADILVHMRPDW